MNDFEYFWARFFVNFQRSISEYSKIFSHILWTDETFPNFLLFRSNWLQTKDFSIVFSLLSMVNSADSEYFCSRQIFAVSDLHAIALGNVGLWTWFFKRKVKKGGKRYVATRNLRLRSIKHPKPNWHQPSNSFHLGSHEALERNLEQENSKFLFLKKKWNRCVKFSRLPRFGNPNRSFFFQNSQALVLMLIFHRSDFFLEKLKLCDATELSFVLVFETSPNKFRKGLRYHRRSQLLNTIKLCQNLFTGRKFFYSDADTKIAQENYHYYFPSKKIPKGKYSFQ